jgi:hypothetical protein
MVALPGQDRYRRPFAPVAADCAEAGVAAAVSAMAATERRIMRRTAAPKKITLICDHNAAGLIRR